MCCFHCAGRRQTHYSTSKEPYRFWTCRLGLNIKFCMNMGYCHHQHAVTSVNNWLNISRLIVSLLDFLRLCRRLPLVSLPDWMESHSFYYWRSVPSWSRMVLFSSLFRHVPIAEAWSCSNCFWFRCCCVGIGLRIACWSQEHSHLQWFKSWWGWEKCSSGRFWLSRGRDEMQQPLQPALGKGLTFCWLPPANFFPSVSFTVQQIRFFDRGQCH